MTGRAGWAAWLKKDRRGGLQRTRFHYLDGYGRTLCGLLPGAGVEFWSGPWAPLHKCRHCAKKV